MKETRLDTFLLKRQISLNLSNLLAENTNIYIKDYGRGALSTASFRGTAPSHTQVSWNGMNINSPMLGMVDFSLIPVFIIDELYIQHGAASLSSQSGGLGGLVEVRNRPDWSNRLSGRVYQDYGSFHTANVYAGLDLGGPAVQSKTRIYRTGSLNDYRFVNKNILEKDSITGELYHPEQENYNAAYMKSGMTQEFYLRIASNAVLSNRTWMQAAERSVPTVLSNEFGEESLRRENIQSDQTIKNVTSYDLFADNTTLKIRSGIDYQQLDYSMQTEVIGLDTRTHVNSKSNMVGWDNQAALKHDFSEYLTAETKASFKSSNIATYDSAVNTGYDTVRLESSFFGGLYYSPAEMLQISLQLRKDHVSDYNSPLIFALGASYKPVRLQDLILKANISRNYHHPTLNDLYWQPGGNPDLLPEEGYSGEITAMYNSEKDPLSINTSLSAYYSAIHNWIMWLPGIKGYWEPMNVKEVRTYGLEYHLTLLLTVKKSLFRFHGNLALTHTLNYGEPFVYGDESAGQQLPFIPRISGNAVFSITNSGYYLNFQHNSMGIRYLLSSNSTAPADDTDQLTLSTGTERMYSLYPHFLNNLTLGKKLFWGKSTLALEFRADNLLNESYRNILQRFMPGRSYNMLIKIDF